MYSSSLPLNIILVTSLKGVILSAATGVDGDSGIGIVSLTSLMKACFFNKDEKTASRINR